MRDARRSSWPERGHWVFDLDGTLTVAAHDFDGFRAAAGLPAGRPILEVLAELPEPRASAVQRRLSAWELEVALRSTPQPGAEELLGALSAAGARLGVLTRNRREIALQTLEAVGLRRFFVEQDVLGRDEAAPKPSPAGLLRLLGRWGAVPEDGVMVGDFLFDLRAGRGAGCRVVYLDPSGRFPHAAEADRCVRGLGELLGGP
jgi:HAD superfamily hydrolase (TIGR01509 family)